MGIELAPELRDLVDSGALAHLTTINADGSPQVTVIWVGRDGDELLSAHMDQRLKLRNIERDPRVVLGRVYVGPDFEFPAAKQPGFVVRYEVERVGGVGPWVPQRS
jgi:Pyridoxamine 5'-phosphate oxidase